MIETIYIKLIGDYSREPSTIGQLWNEIKTKHSAPNRFYHTLGHLEHLYEQLFEIQNQINDWPTILFSLFYHDVIYDATKSNNEEKSAALALKRMKELGVETHIATACKSQILATKTHTEAADSDTNYFTDADLSILGSDWEKYSRYCKNIRKEYAIYPLYLYRKGRKKVVKHFLDMDKIFKTSLFYDKLESLARDNLAREFKEL